MSLSLSKTVILEVMFMFALLTIFILRVRCRLKLNISEEFLGFKSASESGNSLPEPSVSEARVIDRKLKTHQNF